MESLRVSARSGAEVHRARKADSMQSQPLNLLLALFLILGPASQVLAGEISNPEYETWSRFKRCTLVSSPKRDTISHVGL